MTKNAYMMSEVMIALGIIIIILNALANLNWEWVTYLGVAVIIIGAVMYKIGK